MNIVVSAQKLIDKGVFEAFCQEKGLDPGQIAEGEVFDLDIMDAIKYHVLSK